MFQFKNSRGKTVTLLNPSEKGKKYANELKTKIRHTNDGRFVKDEDGPLPLTDTALAYRSGYLDARKDNAKAYKHNKKKKASKQKKS